MRGRLLPVKRVIKQEVWLPVTPPNKFVLRPNRKMEYAWKWIILFMNS